VISLEQVQQLDMRVKKAVSTIKTLNLENADLKKRIAEMEIQLDDIQKEVSNRKADEEQLEEGLQGVLNILNEVVDDEPSEHRAPEEDPHDDHGAVNDESPNSTSQSGQESSEDKMDTEESVESGGSLPDNGEESAAGNMESEDAQENSENARLNENDEEEPDDDDASQSEFDIF